MATPTTKAEFIAYLKRRLGHPVMKIDVTDEQADDRVDDAVNMYIQRHYGGSEKVYLSHQLTAPEIASKTITLDDTIIGVVGVWQIGFTTGSGTTGGTLDGMAWQMLLSDVLLGSGGAVSTGVSDYVVMRVSLNTISEFLVGRFPVRYNERTDELFLDVNPSKLFEGNYVVIEAFRKNDPDDYPDVWSDPWLQRYATEILRKQWGQNLAAKFNNIRLPGDILVDGRTMINEADREIEKLERELVDTWSPISSDMIG